VKRVFNARFAAFLVILAIFSLGSMPSNYFAILRAQNLGSPLFQVLLMLILFNMVYALAALPMGIMSDKLGRRRVLALGWFVYALTYIGFALSGTTWHIWLAFAFLGIYYAISEGVARAFVADLSPPELRGTAYGVYYCVVGIGVLISGFIGGFVWDHIGPAATFYLGACLALLAMVGMLIIIKEAKPAA
jgi:MFS family permease